MQISRHWRIKPQRYRLEGVRYENGEISLSNRPAPVETPRKREDKPQAERVRAAVGR
jgi:hypothetical protein